MHLVLAVHLTQLLLGFRPLPEQEQARLPECQYSDAQAVQRLWKQVCAVTGANFLGDVQPHNLAAQVRYKLARFLRCAALFYHFYTDVPLPPEWAEEGEEARAPKYEELCHYLGLPTNLRDFLMVLGVQDIIDR